MINSIFVIIGTIIGAGFASGKEIFTFFNIYGFWGFVGLLVSECIIGFIIYKAFLIIIKYNINSYTQFINRIIGNNTFITLVVCNVINIFLLISFVVMCAGFSAYFSQEFNISYIFGAILISILSFFTFLKNVDGIIKINTYFIPILILMILSLGLKNICNFNICEYNFSQPNSNWLISSLLYSSYNLILVFPILISLRKHITEIKHAKIVSLGVTFILTLIASILFFLLNRHFYEIFNLELPTVYISSKFGTLYKYIYGFVILGAIFTTAISSGYGFLNNFNDINKKMYTFVAFLICFFSIFLCNLGFSTLLNLLYPILGLCGFFQIVFIVFFVKTP